MPDQSIRRGFRPRSLRRLFDGLRRRGGQLASEGFLQDRLLQARKRLELACIRSCKPLGMFGKRVELGDNLPLPFKCGRWNAVILDVTLIDMRMRSSYRGLHRLAATYWTI